MTMIFRLEVAFATPPFEKQIFVMATMLVLLLFKLLNLVWALLDPWIRTEFWKGNASAIVLIRDDHDHGWSSRDLPRPMSHEAS